MDLTTLLILGLVVVTALAFDFTNGFHDTGNAMATSIATGALPPRVAVALSACLNLAGAFLSFKVAEAIAKGLVDQDAVSLPIILAGLCGGILWNLLTWLLGLPSSSSHALIGGVVGAVMVGSGASAVIWAARTPGADEGLLNKVIMPAVFSPLVALVISAVATWAIYAITRRVAGRVRERGFRIGQIGSASLVSLAHGTNDAQKTMGIIALALGVAQVPDPAPGSFSATFFAGTPWWVVVSCAVCIAAGTYMGGWRIIRTLGKGLVEIEAPQGMAAETSSAAVLLVSSHAGMPLSTTHVATGSILGTGVGKPGAAVRWGIAGRMVVAWMLTLPAAALVGALCAGITGILPGRLTGPLVVFALLVALSGCMWWRSRQNHVDHSNVNHDWDQGNATHGAPQVARGER